MSNVYEHGSNHPINKKFPIGINGNNTLSIIDGKLVFTHQSPDTDEVPTIDQVRMGYDKIPHVFDGKMINIFNRFFKKNKNKLNRIYKDNSIVDYFMQIIYPNDTIFCKLRGYRKYLPWTERLYLWLNEHRSISFINKILVKYERKQSDIMHDKYDKAHNELSPNQFKRFGIKDTSNIPLDITEACSPLNEKITFDLLKSQYTGGIYYDESTKSYILIDDEIKEYQMRDEGNTGESLAGYEKEYSYHWTMTK